MESVPEWPDLVPDLLVQIASKLTVLEDFTAMRGVCTSWRAAAAATRDDKVARLSNVPLLMLPAKDGCHVSEFYSLCKRKVCMRMAVPETRGKICLDAGFGWILTSTRVELNLVRFQPAMNSSHLKIQLPATWDFSRNDFLQQAVLSANPSETSDFVLMLVSNQKLVFWRNGDSSWSDVWERCPPFLRSFIGSICAYKRRFHAFDYYGKMFVWDPDPSSKIFSVQVIISEKEFMMPYLVVSSKGELLLIMRSLRSEPVYKFLVRRFDAEMREFETMEDLEGDAVFIGLNSAVSVAPAHSPDTIKPNCIYLTSSDQVVGIYNVVDGSFQRFSGVESLFSKLPPLWIFPSF